MRLQHEQLLLSSRLNLLLFKVEDRLFSDGAEHGPVHCQARVEQEDKWDMKTIFGFLL